jgi:hypothetical protein
MENKYIHSNVEMQSEEIHEVKYCRMYIGLAMNILDNVDRPLLFKTQF